MTWAPDYLALEEMKAYLRIDDVDTQDDVDIAVAITAASRAIDENCNRQFGRVAAPEARRYVARPGRCGTYVMSIDDLVIVTGAAIAVDAGTIDDYDFEPSNAVAEGKAYTRLVIRSTSSILPSSTDNVVTMTALWGWSAVPTAIKMATYLQAARFFKRKDAPFGIAGSPDSGSEMRLLSRVDPDVRVALTGYSRPRSVA